MMESKRKSRRSPWSFPNCHICTKMKEIEDQGKSVSESELRKIFEEAEKHKGTINL